MTYNTVDDMFGVFASAVNPGFLSRVKLNVALSAGSSKHGNVFLA